MCAVFTELIPSCINCFEGRKSRKKYVNNFISVLSRCNFEFSDTVEGMSYLCTYSRNKNDWHCYMQVVLLGFQLAFYSCLLWRKESQASILCLYSYITRCQKILETAMVLKRKAMLLVSITNSLFCHKII